MPELEDSLYVEEKLFEQVVPLSEAAQHKLCRKTCYTAARQAILSGDIRDAFVRRYDVVHRRTAGALYDYAATQTVPQSRRAQGK
jgi:hypothetical protein